MRGDVWDGYTCQFSEPGAAFRFLFTRSLGLHKPQVNPHTCRIAPWSPHGYRRAVRTCVGTAISSANKQPLAPCCARVPLQQTCGYSGGILRQTGDLERGRYAARWNANRRQGDAESLRITHTTNKDDAGTTPNTDALRGKTFLIRAVRHSLPAVIDALSSVRYLPANVFCFLWVPPSRMGRATNLSIMNRVTTSFSNRTVPWCIRQNDNIGYNMPCLECVH